MTHFKISGKIVDPYQRQLFPGVIEVLDGTIVSITYDDTIDSKVYILPGFIDAHVHIESSMLIPSEFARLAVPHGTVATVSDPHEIGNVLGIDGVRYMIDNGKQVPFYFYFGAPSCVPATTFETAGATITAAQISDLFKWERLKYLSEMMNYPGVLARDPLVMEKIHMAQIAHLPIDGHAPGLKGAEAEKYCSAGITTDHECYMLSEAIDKIKYGMMISIREGSAAKNYEALHPLIGLHPDKVMFCSDDKHPHELVKGHINLIVKRSIVDHGYDLMDVLRCACYHPIKHYKLPVGYLQKDQPADFIVVDNLTDFNVLRTYIKGQVVAEKGRSLIHSVPSEIVNKFNTSKKKADDFAVKAESDSIRVIRVLDGELITEKVVAHAKVEHGQYVSDVEHDILKLVVVNRYEDAPAAVGFITGFGLQKGAMASCIAHDSHNIIAVGVTDADICQAVNGIIDNKGGISVAADGRIEVLPLPIAGIMSNQDGYQVAACYSHLDGKAKELGTRLQAPFMSLSFMALLVIPSLKLSDKGLFDGSSFTFTTLSI